MSKVVNDYASAFGNTLKSDRNFRDRMHVCRGRGLSELVALGERVGDGDANVGEEEAKKILLNFLKDGDATALTALVAPSLEAFDKIDSAESRLLQRAARKKVKNNFALWHAHKLLIDWLLEDTSRLGLLDKHQEFGPMVRTREGQALNRAVWLTGFWTELYPDLHERLSAETDKAEGASA